MSLAVSAYPRKATGRPPAEGWYETFLASLRQTGAWYLSAEAAGVTYHTVRQHCDANPSFGDAAEHAEQRYLDDLAVALPHDSRAYIGKLARLKTRRPEYNDKLVNFNLNVDANLSDDKVLGLVRDLLSSMQSGSAIAALEAHEQKAALPAAVSEVRSEGNGASATPRREVIDVQAEPVVPVVDDLAAPSSTPTRSARPPRRKKHVS